MKKGLVAIIAVAIIGILGLGKNHQNSATLAAPSSNSTTSGQTTVASSSNTTYKDGTYTGRTQDTAYGPVQIAVVISGGKITDVKLLQMPSDRSYSQEVTSVAGPLLKQTTLQKQSPQIDFVSGATSTSNGYQQSLQSALDQAV